MDPLRREKPIRVAESKPAPEEEAVGGSMWVWVLLAVGAVTSTVLSGGAARADAAGEPLGGTQLLKQEGDLAEQMVAGIDRFLDRELSRSVEQRAHHWKRDFSSPEAYHRFVEPNRQRLRKYLGVVDTREPFADLEVIGSPTGTEAVAKTKRYRVLAVRWPVLKGFEAEGLLLEPNDHRPAAQIIALPDCDWTPEMLAGLAPGVSPEARYARLLAERGCRVLIPMLIDRKDTHSGNPAIRMTNQPHREFIYRAAFEMGRHVIGYEIQKVLSAVDWMSGSGSQAVGRSGVRVFGSSGARGGSDPGSNGAGQDLPSTPIGVVGYGEGGLLALYAAALDSRIDAALVSGYFQPREKVWSEPIYRNVFGLLEEFGDAEVGSLIAPRPLVVEHCRFPEVSGPPAARTGRAGAAPGTIVTPALAEVTAEADRARRLTLGLGSRPWLQVVESKSGQPGSWNALTELMGGLGLETSGRAPATPRLLKDRRTGFDPEVRFKRQFDQLVEHTQRMMREGEFRRNELWAKADGSSVEKWRESTRRYRDLFWEEVIGKLPPASEPMNPRTRLVYDEPTYRGYEVMLDVYPDVYAYGILLVPKDLRPGERRPVVVCQHGLEGKPQQVADPKVNNPHYHQFANRLTERGFITFSPQNPYIGKDKFRVLQRKLNPLKKTLFSVIVRQHERILDWLAGQPFVDAERIAFYGLSYGGKTAMRVPALLERYCASICSGDFNEWIAKNATVSHPFSYMFTGEYEIFEFDLGNTFNYAEMAWLICPRPFMVERGRNDGVAIDEWVGYEFARVDQRYHRLGIPERTEIEWFVGPHEINGVGSFNFLHRHLGLPAPQNAKGAKDAKSAKKD